jgi:hypothetical protein
MHPETAPFRFRGSVSLNGGIRAIGTPATVEAADVHAFSGNVSDLSTLTVATFRFDMSRSRRTDVCRDYPAPRLLTTFLNATISPWCGPKVLKVLKQPLASSSPSSMRRSHLGAVLNKGPKLMRRSDLGAVLFQRYGVER